MILEVVILNIIPGQEKQFEAAFEIASPIVASMIGYLWHQLQHCVEAQNRYLLLVQWQRFGSAHGGLSWFRIISGVAKTPPIIFMSRSRP